MFDFFKSIFTYIHSAIMYLREHFIRFFMITLIFLLAVSILPFCQIENTVVDGVITEQHILILGITLSNWGTYITAVGLFITAMWALYQFDKNKTMKQQEKAADIAKEFADILAEKLSIISAVLTSNKKIAKLLSSIDKNKLQSFDRYEIKNISSNPKIFSEYLNEFSSKNIQKSYEELLRKVYNQDEIKKFNSNFQLLVENTLNELEYICMNISSQAAGSQYIYPSLHQLFLPFVHIVSVLISRSNNTSPDKYFINIIAVYNMWNQKRNKELASFNKTKLAIDKLEKKKDTKIQKLLHKKPKTV